MANNPNASANLIPAKKGEVRNPKGRPKNKLKDLKDVTGLTKDDMLKGMGIILALPIDQIELLARSRKEPIWKVGIAAAIKADIDRGVIPTFDSLADRKFGKATQSVNSTTTSYNDVKFVD